MKQIESNEEIVLEGELLLAAPCVKLFNDISSLCEWLDFVRPEQFQINTAIRNDNGNKVYQIQYGREV